MGPFGSPWCGLNNFEKLFRTPDFIRIMRNTFALCFWKILIGFPVPILLALLINEVGNRIFQRTVQTVVYLPHFISWIIAASFISDILSLRGPINTLIGQLGGDPVYFMAETKWFQPILVLSAIWKNSGWSSIVYIAAITGIDQDLYEASSIDGAKKLQQIWFITLPCIRTTIITLFILEVGKIMSAGFDQVYNLYSPVVYSVGDILDTYTYRQGIVKSNYSYATAAGLFQNVIGFILVIASNVTVKRLSDGEEGLW